ncbi:hypothetical protein N2152v2_005711 [Parachlorella kessleri]
MGWGESSWRRLGAATARSLVETHLVTAEAGEGLLAGEGHERQLKQSASANQLSGAFEVQVNPGVPCNDFPRVAGTAPNQQFRLAVQDVAAFAATQCTFYSPNVQYVTQISTKCRVNPQTTLARSVYIEYKTIGVDDSAIRTCFNDNIQHLIGDGYYGAWYVNPALPAAGQDKWRVTAPLPVAPP